MERVSRFERRGDGLAHCLGRRDICTKSVVLSITSNMTLQLLFPRKHGAEGVELGKYIGVWKLGQCLGKCKFCFRISECFFQTIFCKPISKFFSQSLNVEFWSSLIPTQVLFFPPSDFPANPSHVHTSEVQSDVNAVTSISGNWHNGPPTMPTHMLVRREDVNARKPSDKRLFFGLLESTVWRCSGM